MSLFLIIFSSGKLLKKYRSIKNRKVKSSFVPSKEGSLLTVSWVYFHKVLHIWLFLFFWSQITGILLFLWLNNICICMFIIQIYTYIIINYILYIIYKYINTDICVYIYIHTHIHIFLYFLFLSIHQ